MAVPLWLLKLLIRTGVARLLPSVRRLTDGGAEFLHYYNDRVLTAPLRELQAAAEFREAFALDIIDLNAGEPRLDLLPPRLLPGERRGTPPLSGLPELRAAIAEQFSPDPRQPLTPGDEVLVTAGATGALSVALDAFVNAGDRVVLFDPSSPLFALALRHRRAHLRWVPTWLDGGHTRFHLEPFAKALRGAKMLVLADPGNPTGGTLAAEDLEQIAWWANRFDVLLYVDESLSRYRYEGVRPPLAVFPGAARRTLTAGSLSKGHGLAAARVGWLTGFRHLIRPCLVTAALTTPYVATASQLLAVAALRQGNDSFSAVRAAFAVRRRYTYDRLAALGIAPGWPAGGFSLWAPVGLLGVTGRQFAERLLRERRVLVGPGDLYGPGGTNYVRVSYAADEGRLREGLARLTEFVGLLRTPKADGGGLLARVTPGPDVG